MEYADQMTVQSSSPRPKKTLIFHIGDHKTGSTSIQLAFAQRQIRLDGASVFYPAKLALNVLGDHCAAYAKAASSKAKQAAIRPFQRLAARISKSDGDFALVSAEAFEGVPASLFHEIVQSVFSDCADEIRIIAYVRPHAARIVSSYVERVKSGAPKTSAQTLEEFSNSKRLNGEFIYWPRFHAWRNAFGENFLLRPMIREKLINKSVLDDFIHHAFGGIDYELAGDSPANVALCLEDLMRLKILHENLRRLRGGISLRRTVGWEFARISGMLPPPNVQTKLRLHKLLAEEIRTTYMQDAKDMDRDFFDGRALLEEELNRAVEQAIDTPQSTEPGDYFSESELRSLAILSSMIASMMEADAVNWPSFLHSKRERDVEIARRAIEKRQSAE
ncbi:MAG: hypothetical protein D6754_13420 [Alphaproteobacteria bacterium]|nr:MAG: hypothetical protein D6754_13420 [Alphaproteobacteria bacterium]